jgi:hypothetical protein
MSTKTDFYLGRGLGAEWVGALQQDCAPPNLLRVPPGRLALTATDEHTYRAAVADLFIVWETEGIGAAYPRRAGWPWPWPTSHVSSWIITFDPLVGGVFATVGGGVCWARIDPRKPREPSTEGMEPPDIEAWLRAPAAPPSVPLPLMRDPGTGLPTAAGQALTTRDDSPGGDR